MKYIIDFDAKTILPFDGVTPVAPPPVPVAPPVVAPPVQISPPAPSVVNAGGISDWDLHPKQLWPQAGTYITGSGDTGGSVRFVVDAGRFPRGVMIEGRDESQPSKGKEYVISDKPYTFEPLNGNPLAQTFGGNVAGPIYLRFGTPAETRPFFGTQLPSLDVETIPGSVLYINFRESRNPGDTTPRGTVYSEFVCTDRNGID